MNYRYIKTGRLIYNLDISIFKLLYWVAFGAKLTYVKRRFSFVDAVKSHIKFHFLKNRTGHIYILPYGHVGVADNDCFRLFDLKNKLVYRNKRSSKEVAYIKRLMFTPEIVGETKQYYCEELIEGITFTVYHRIKNKPIVDYYNNHIKEYIISNIKYNNCLFLDLYSYTDKLKDQIDEFYQHTKDKSKIEYVYNQLHERIFEIKKYENIKIPLVLSHGDLHPKNIILCKGGIKLIDSEYVDYRNVMYDLFDYFYLFNHNLKRVEKINPKKEAIKQAEDILIKMAYQETIDLQLLCNVYIVERMVIHLCLRKHVDPTLTEWYKSFIRY